MLRNLSYVLIGTMAAALVVGTFAVLLWGLADLASGSHMLRLAALDAVAPAGAAQIEVRLLAQDVERGRAFHRPAVYARFPGGQVVRAWPWGTGYATAVETGSLPPGPNVYEATADDTSPRLDIRARGTVWVAEAGRPVLWVEAAALVPNRPVPGRTPAPPAEAMAAMKTLAAGRQVVYLVATEMGDYALVRQGLESAGVPAGPAVWLRPGLERETLAALKRDWPQVRAALVSSPALVRIAQNLKVTAKRVAPAEGKPAEPAEAVTAWSDAARELSGTAE